MKTVWKSKCLDTEHSSPTAARDYRHWRTVLLNYMEDFQAKIPNKYQDLFSYIKSSEFRYIEWYIYFEVAIEKTGHPFHKKTPNEVFSRYMLATRRQKPGESLYEFFR